MAIENNLQLISYLAAAEIYDQGKTIYECFLPIVESALICNEINQSISFLHLQSVLHEAYHLNVPKSTLKKLLDLLQDQKKIKFIDKRKIVLCRDQLNNTFFDKREERESLIEDFFIAFNDFLISNEIDVPLSEIKQASCEWLYVNSLELAYFINNGVLGNDVKNVSWEYSSQLIEFLLDIQEKNSIHFKTFLLLYNGAVQSSLLNFETDKINNICESSIPFKNIILDTNFILRMLDLQSEFDCSVAKETLSALKSQNTKFFILDQTLTEVQNSIKSYLSDSAPYVQYTQVYLQGHKIRMTGFWEAARRGVSRSSIFEKSKRENLKNSILELIDVTFIDDFDDSKISNTEIESLVLSKKRDSYGEKQARHDLSMIKYCKKHRNRPISSVTDISWWVLTNDEKLTFWNQQNNDYYQECLTEIQLSNLMWLQGNRNDNLGLTQTIVSLSTNASITYNDIEQFAKKVHKYQQKNENSTENLDKISLLFASNMLTTSDIQKISSEDDALEQMLEVKVSAIQEAQELQKQQGEKLSTENELLIQKNKILSVKLEKTQYERKIDKYKRDLSDLQHEQENINKELNILKILDESKDKINKSSGRLVTIFLLISLVILSILYIKFGYPLVLSIIEKINFISEFAQDVILFIVPILLYIIYYIFVGIVFGKLLSPKELFNEIKSKLLNTSQKKYMKKNNIDLKYFGKNLEFEIAKKESAFKNIERNIQIIQNRITELNEKISSLGDN